MSLNRQQTLSFDVLGLSYKEVEEDERAMVDMNDHIESLKAEITKITEELVKISKENENLLTANETMAKDYLKTHKFIEVSQVHEKLPASKSNCSRSNSNANEELFKFIDGNHLSPGHIYK